MKLSIHSTPVSRGISGVLLVLFVFYAIFTLGMPVLLVSFALGMIIYSIYDSLEIATAVTIIVGVILSFTRLSRKGSYGKEGFEDAKKEETNSDKKSESASEEKPVEKAKFTDGPAPATASALSSGSEAAPLNDANSKGQFKLGQIPKEEKGGYFVDQGTTLMNALNGLKPEQITAMTSDTKQLLETQKSLMGMLDSLAPMMKESGSLLNMFQNMFGKDGNAGLAAATTA
jgi:hypothetical protein